VALAIGAGRAGDAGRRCAPPCGLAGRSAGGRAHRVAGFAATPRT